MTLQATYTGANGWLLDFAAPGETLRLLVDPWLCGSLVFPPGPWLLRGELPHPWPIPEALDLLLLTQGLADHCHRPSLELLPRDLAVVASLGAARQVQSLGFHHVTALRPGQSHRHGGLTLTATAGAAVPQLENGYLLDHAGGSLYLEPHGFLAHDLLPRSLDAVITPVLDLGLPLVGAFVRGSQVLPQLLERFQPRTVLASSAGGDVRFEGLLQRWLWVQGSAAEAAETVAQGQAAGCRFIDPVPGQPYTLPVD